MTGHLKFSSSPGVCDRQAVSVDHIQASLDFCRWLGLESALDQCFCIPQKSSWEAAGSLGSQGLLREERLLDSINKCLSEKGKEGEKAVCVLHSSRERG